MDYENLLKFFGDNFIGWLRVTFLTLARPVSRFELTPVDDLPGLIAPEARSEQQLWLNPRLIVFAVISIILGVTVNALIPERETSPALFTTITVILFYWFVRGSLLYVVCWLLQGTGRYLDTLSVSIQVFGTIYVVASFLSLLGTSVLSPDTISELTRGLPVTKGFGPILLFFFVGNLLLIIYMPLAMKPVHKFDWARTAALFVVWATLLILLFCLIDWPLYLSIHILAGIHIH
jgi:hypothetical protein